MRRNFTYAELTNGVRTLSDPAIQWWSDRFADFNFTPKDVCDYLTWGMPGDRDNCLERIDISSHLASVEVKGYDDQGEVFWAGRTIQFQPLELNLDVLEIREDYQSLGYGKLLLANSYRFAKLLGFKRLTLKAIGIGSYAWSKAGFLASAESWKGDRCRGRIEAYVLQRRNFFGPELTSTLFSYVRSDDPAALWMLSSYKEQVPLMKRPDVRVPLGVALLHESDSSWTGSIELEDSMMRRKQIGRVRRYIGLNADE